MLLEQATLPDGSPAFDERELTHMQDVRSLFVPLQWGGLAVMLALAILAVALARTRLRTVVPRGLLVGALATLGIALIAVPLILLGFDDFFTGFHEMLFEGDSWRFSSTDTLIRIYPERFWEDVSTLAAGFTVAQALLLGALAWWWLGVAKRRGAVIELRRGDGAPVLRIGHRGAAHLAPENTIRSLRAAVEQGVDLVEFDVLDLPLGPLVLAHSDHLDEVSHGRATGSRARADARRAPRARTGAPDAGRCAGVLRRRGARRRPPRRSEARDAPRRARDRAAAVRARAADGRLLVPPPEPARGRAGGSGRADRVHLPGGPLRRLPPAAASAARRRGHLRPPAPSRRGACPA